MSTGITFAKIVVASALLAVFLGAGPLMDVMRNHRIWPMGAARLRVTPPPAAPQAARKPLPRVRPQGARKPLPRVRPQVRRPEGPIQKRRGRAFDTYEVPAASVLPALLRAPLDSHTTRVEERVRAILRSSVKQGRVELIPAGSMIYGSVLDVVPASRWQPRGRIVVGFYIIDHAGTGARIAIAARPVVFEAIDVMGTSAVRRTLDVRANAGELLHITLLDALSLRFPK
jgi:hypothetical protein